MCRPREDDRLGEIRACIEKWRCQFGALTTTLSRPQWSCHTNASLTRLFSNVSHCSAFKSCQSFTQKSLWLRNFHFCKVYIYCQYILWLTPHFVGITHFYHPAVYREITSQRLRTNEGGWNPSVYPPPKTFWGLHLTSHPPLTPMAEKKVFTLKTQAYKHMVRQVQLWYAKY
jgi:hypothetical protein